MNFIEKCVSGQEKPESIDDYIDIWHTSTISLPLHTFLGLTLSEYESWVKNPENITAIIKNRATHKKANP